MALKKRKKKKLLELLNKVSRVLSTIFGVSVILCGASMAVLALTLPNWQQLSSLNFVLLLEYLKVIIWPGIAIIVLFTLKQEILALVRRMKSARLGNNAIEFTSQQTALEPNTSLEVVTDEKQKNETPEDFKNRVYKEAEVQLAFERVYRNIFGTQISLLLYLAANPAGVHTKLLEPFYDRYRQMDSSTNPFQDIHDYMAYLKSNGLVDYIKSNNIYQLTDPAGTLFLRYLAEHGLGDPNSKFL